jgi:outer membrane protein OmpA-like peptidoglycan-associated protein
MHALLTVARTPSRRPGVPVRTQALVVQRCGSEPCGCEQSGPAPESQPPHEGFSPLTGLGHDFRLLDIDQNRPQRLNRLGARHRTEENDRTAARDDPSNASPIIAQVLRSSGTPLARHVRSPMEAGLKHDFGHVRVHTGSLANESARAVEAVAYTAGSHIVFSDGTYQPERPGGLGVIAHELVHVVQQSGSAARIQDLDRLQLDRGAGDPLEVEARSAAGMVAAGASEPITVRPGQRPFVQRKGISLELKDAESLPLPATSLTGLTTDELHVLAWLRDHQAQIAAAETKWKVDRRAIAGAIAWEALVNVRGTLTQGFRGEGAGKVHYSANVTFGEGDPVSKQVEALGKLPAQTMASRKKLLKTPANAIEYIGAIMDAFSDVAEKYSYSIRCSPDILTNCYQGGGVQEDLKAWDKHLAAKAKGSPIKAGNAMALWTTAHLKYLEDGVGTTSLVCMPSGVAAKATKAVPERAAKGASSEKCIAVSGEVDGPRFLFHVAEARFRPGYESALAGMAHTIPPDVTLEIHGYASEEGPPAFNENLSCLRANKAVEILTASGFPASRIGPRYAHGATAGSRPDHRSVVLTAPNFSLGPPKPKKPRDRSRTPKTVPAPPPIILPPTPKPPPVKEPERKEKSETEVPQPTFPFPKRKREPWVPSLQFGAQPFGTSLPTIDLVPGLQPDDISVQIWLMYGWQQGEFKDPLTLGERLHFPVFEPSVQVGPGVDFKGDKHLLAQLTINLIRLHLQGLGGDIDLSASLGPQVDFPAGPGFELGTPKLSLQVPVLTATYSPEAAQWLVIGVVGQGNLDVHGSSPYLTFKNLTIETYAAVDVLKLLPSRK